MKMFFWSSEALANWGSGYIFALAENADAARLIVMSHAKKQFGDDSRLIPMIENDIASEPTTPDVMLLNGSA